MVFQARNQEPGIHLSQKPVKTMRVFDSLWERLLPSQEIGFIMSGPTPISNHGVITAAFPFLKAPNEMKYNPAFTKSNNSSSPS